MARVGVITLLLLAASLAACCSGQSTYDGSGTFVIIPTDEEEAEAQPSTAPPPVNAAMATEEEEAASSTSTVEHTREASSCMSISESFQAHMGLKNGTELSLLLALPLTFKGQAYLNPGFFQLAAVLLAIDHFNERKSTVIPELADWQDCPVRIDYETLVVMDTGTLERNAMNTLTKTLDERKRLPNAIVGGYNEIPTNELSTVASTLRIPLVSHRGLDHNLLLPTKHPYVTQVNPDLYADMLFLGEYLQHTNRTDYVAVLYASSADSAIQRLEVFRGVALSLHMKNVKSFGYVSPNTLVDSHHPSQNISIAMKHLKDSGYRTIVWLTPYFDEEIVIVGQAAHDNKLDRGDHFWVIGAAMEIDKPMDTPGTNQTMMDDWASRDGAGHSHTDSFDPSEFDIDVHDMEDLQRLDTEFNAFQEINFMRNAAFLRQSELLDVRDANHSPFMREWTSLNESFIERLLELNPVETEEYQKEWLQYKFMSPMLGWVASKDFPHGGFPPKDLFAKPVPFLSSPPSGALNLYDALMSIGIGACKASADLKEKRRREQQESSMTMDDDDDDDDDDTLTGDLLQEGIRSSHFSGASGEVRFGDGFPGSRMGSTVTYHVVNLFPSGFFSDLYAVSEVRNASTGEWYEHQPFIYAGGSTSPPELLRDPADQNYLSKGVRIAGLTLMVTALLAIVSSFIWVAVHRHHSIVVASQPVFLYFICMGSTLTSFTILLLSFDESHGWTANELTVTCKAVPWLAVLGHIFCYNCLFSKLWRVNRVLQFSRRQVTFVNVLWPAWLIEMTAFILLSVWTATTSYHWERIEIDEVTGESMGQCVGEKEYAFWIPISILVMIPTILTGIMAYKTIDVDAAYSEAKWIFALMLCQCQVIIVSVPMLFILGDVSTDGRFLGSSLILWTFPMTTVGLIFVPKMVAVHFPPGGDQRRESRGSTGGVRVSGITSSQEDKSGLTYSHLSRQSGVSRQSDVSPAMSQSAVSALTRSTRHAHVTVH